MMGAVRSEGPTTPVRVLVIEDDELERKLAVTRLENEGYAVVTAAGGEEGMRRLFASRPDIVVLDVVMPGMDGWKTLEQIRAVTDTPVVMLTAQDSELERVRGLRSGADDYVGKPYSGAELVARIRAVLRRTKATTMRDVIDDGVVRVDFHSSEVTVRGAPVSLTPLESRLLVAFLEHPGQTLSQAQLVELVWDGASTGANEVRLYVRYLRQKIEENPSKPELIETLRGFGYRYRKP
jgi:DNA-binding response OmpR family regulator